MDIELQETYQEKALKQLQADADKIAQLIKVQMDHLTMPQCPSIRRSIGYTDVWPSTGN